MNKENFLSICLNPVLQKTIVLKGLHENEVNRSNEYYFDASGKGVNVSRVLTQLEQNVIYLTQSGGKNKKLFLNMVKNNGIKTTTVNSNSEIRSCYTLLNKNNKTSTEIVEEAHKVDIKTEEKIYKKFLKILPKIDIVIISGTKAAGFSDNLYPSIVKKSKMEGKVTVLDLKGNDLKNSLKYHPDVIKPNLTEFAATFMNKNNLKENNKNNSQIDEVKEKMLQLQSKYRCIIILTRGKFATLFTKNNKIFKIKPEIIIPVNTIGCGDSFTAGFVSVFNHYTLENAIKRGHHCAKLNAMQIRPGCIK